MEILPLCFSITTNSREGDAKKKCLTKFQQNPNLHLKKSKYEFQVITVQKAFWGESRRPHPRCSHLKDLFV